MLSPKAWMQALHISRIQGYSPSIRPQSAHSTAPFASCPVRCWKALPKASASASPSLRRPQRSPIGSCRSATTTGSKRFWCRTERCVQQSSTERCAHQNSNSGPRRCRKAERIRLHHSPTRPQHPFAACLLLPRASFSRPGRRHCSHRRSSARGHDHWPARSPCGPRLGRSRC